MEPENISGTFPGGLLVLRGNLLWAPWEQQMGEAELQVPPVGPGAAGTGLSPRQAHMGSTVVLANLSLSQVRGQLANLSYCTCSWSWACRTVLAARRSHDQHWQNEPEGSEGRWEIWLLGGRWAHWRAVNLILWKGWKQGRFSPPTQELAVPAAPPPNFFLPLEKALWFLGSHGLHSTTGSCRAVLPGELLAGIYSGRLGVALWHLFSSLSFLWNTHCLFFLVIESPPVFALFTYLLWFQQLLENVHSGTSLSPWVCLAAAFDCPVLWFSLSDRFYGEKGSGQGLSHPLLQHTWVEWRLTVSPRLLCCLALLCPYAVQHSPCLSGRGWCPSRWRRSLVLLGAVAQSCTGRGFAGQVPAVLPLQAEGVEEWKTVGERCGRTEHGRGFVVPALQGGLATKVLRACTYLCSSLLMCRHRHSWPAANWILLFLPSSPEWVSLQNLSAPAWLKHLLWNCEPHTAQLAFSALLHFLLSSSATAAAQSLRPLLPLGLLWRFFPLVICGHYSLGYWSF